MEKIAWSESFEVGDPQLDREHRGIFDLINSIYAAFDYGEHNKLNPWLDELYLLAKAHFQNENRALIRLNSRLLPANIPTRIFIQSVIDAALDDHMANHTNMLALLGRILSGIRRELKMPQAQLGPSLSDWFIDHTILFDRRLRAVFKAFDLPM